MIHSTHDSKVRIHRVPFRNVLQYLAKTSTVKRPKDRTGVYCHIGNVRYALARMSLSLWRLTIHPVREDAVRTTASATAAVDDLVLLALEIVPYNMNHNAEACVVLMKIEIETRLAGQICG